MSVTPHPVDLEATLRERFGLERFRPGQREVIDQVLLGRDVLCVMPTGGGKSLCYQLPALLLGGLTLVVSPLIALMKDQVDVLVQRGLRATLINSTLDPAEQHARIIEIEAGRYDLVYVAPERFRSHRFLEAMAKARPALLAIDEAHCISEWGHDFRPDYARIGLAPGERISPCIALTATATDVVRRDIADQLDLRDPSLFVTGFDRPNLRYAVVEARRDPDKLAALADVLDQNPGPAIVYASSRARCESVRQHLERELRRVAVVYHAGLTREERTQSQERFMRGEAEIVVATNAFGMGVDKADIRSVIHYNLPGTLEAYYQEAGRAGRDGKPACCTLLFSYGDRFLQEMFIENEYPPAAMVYKVYNYLRGIDADPIELTQAEIRESAAIDLNEQAVGTALKLLESVGAIEKFLPRENMAIVRINAEPDDPSLVGRLGPQAHTQRTVLIGLEGLVNRRFGETIYFHPDEFAAALGLDRPALGRALKALASELPIDYVPPFRGNAIRINDRDRKPSNLGIDFAALEKRKQREYDKLERMIKYAQTNRCRRAYILSYFGDANAAQIHCGHCDNCGPDQASGSASSGAVPIDTAAGREFVLKVLSGVARAKGRFGKLTVAQMLNGSTSEKMDRGGLKQLSTYGILTQFKQLELVQVLDALAAAGLVETREEDRFPVINLTDSGWVVLRGHCAEPLALAIAADLGAKVRNGGLDRMPPRPTAEPSSPEAEPHPSSSGDPLSEKLRSLRLEWAREASQPAYCIFTNQTLDELVRTRPATPQALAAIKGLGPARLERYGAALIETIAASPVPDKPTQFREGEAPAEPGAGAGPRLGGSLALPESNALLEETDEPTSHPARSRSAAYVPTEEWTWRLLDRGFTLDDAAAIRGLDLSAVIRHATLAVRQGRAIAPELFLDPETVRRWDDWRAEQGDAVPPSGLEPSAPLWVLFLACRTGRRPTNGPPG